MNFFDISIPLLIGGGILIFMTQRTLRLSRLDQLQHISELAKMHKEICEKVSLMDTKYIERDSDHNTLIKAGAFSQKRGLVRSGV